LRGKDVKCSVGKKMGCFLTSKEDFETKFRVFKGKVLGNKFMDF
jgi:hypothetical protein